MMAANHLVLLVEEPSMEAFLTVLLPRILPEDLTFEIHPFQGKPDLLKKLLSRLRAYAKWLPPDHRILVVVDRDDDACTELRATLESIANAAGLRTKSSSTQWQIVNRIAIEELEAWYFGDWTAVCQVYPKVARSIPQQSSFRDADAITGGTWEAFERILQKNGYFTTGLRKTEAARDIAAVLEPSRCTSKSFIALRDAVTAAIS